MRKLTIYISDVEYKMFGIKQDDLLFTEFVDLVSKELSRQTLNDCVELSERYGLSKMTMDEITDEVKAVRRDAK